MMTKAYDLKDLAHKLELAGLPVLKEAGEETAKQVYVAVKEWLKESATVSTTPVDNIVMGFIDNLDALVLPMVDKIDGQVG